MESYSSNVNALANAGNEAGGKLTTTVIKTWITQFIFLHKAGAYVTEY